MKQLIPTLILFFITLLTLNAQIAILDQDGRDVTNSIISVDATPDQDVATVNLFVSNQGGDDVNVAVKKLEENVAAGMTHNFCWNDNCFAGKTAADDFVGSPLELAPATITSDRTLYTELWTAGQAGESSVTYQFVDLLGNSEPVEVTLEFKVEAIETEISRQPSPDPFLMDASPNPAREFTWIPYSLPSGTQKASVVIRNLLGNVVTILNLDTDATGVRLDTGDLSNGIYIYSLLIDSKPQVTKRLIVSN